MQLPLIAVFRGGYSGESVISHQSAARMMQALDATRYNAVFITVAREGWTCADREEQVLPLDRSSLRVDLGTGLTPVSGALIAIHGSPGENGLLQGYLDMLGIPYQTGGVLNMALTFSKFSTTAMLRQLGFPVAPSILLVRDTLQGAEDRVRELGYPCFVKPDQSGSSLGVTKVKHPDELQAALTKAFQESEAVMVEGAVSGRELTCGVLRTGGTVKPMPVCEVRTSREFFDYEAKYHAQDTEELIPAPLREEVTRLVQERSVAIYTALQCRGMVRVDHFWTGTELITIELNTVPGFSGASIFPKMLTVDGLGVERAIGDLVEDLLSKGERGG